MNIPLMARRAVMPLMLLVYGLMSLHVMVAFVSGSSFAVNNMWGNAPIRPVAFRVLMPTLTSVVEAVIPDAVKQPVTSELIAFRNGPHFEMLRQLRKPPAEMDMVTDELIFHTAVAMCLVWISLIAFIAMLYQLTRALLPQSPVYAMTAPVVAMLLLPAFVIRYSYTYDFAELFFSCACFYLLYRQRWGAYLLCFALATLNKETSMFGIFFYAVWFLGKLPCQRYLLLGAAQVAIFALIQVPLRLYYAPLPDIAPFTPMQHLHDQALMLFGYDYVQVIVMAATVWLLTSSWREKPAFLRGGLWMLVPNGLAFILTCTVGEYRDLYWCLPVLIILATHTLVSSALRR